MPEGSFAVVSETVRRPRAKKEKPLTEAQLIALCREAIEANKAVRIFGETVDNIYFSDRTVAQKREGKRLCTEMMRMFRIVETTPAHTLVGLKAKAEVIIDHWDNEPDSERLAEWSVLLDIVRGIETEKAPDEAQDRRLIKLCQEMIRLDDAGAAADGDTKVKLHDEAFEVRKKLVQAKAKTAEGIRWKARALNRYLAPDLDLRHMPTAFAASLVQDILGGVDVTTLAIVHPDAALIALADEYCDLDRKQGEFYNGPKAIAEDDEREAACEPFNNRQKIILVEMEKLRASTLDGFIARARAMEINGVILPGDPHELARSTFQNEALVGMILRDLVDHANGEPVSAISVPPAPVENPDASLIKLCAEHIRNHTTFNADAPEALTEAKRDRLWDIYQATYDAVIESEPLTLSGIIAKAKVVKAEITDPDGEENPLNEPTMMWSVVTDLLRLDGNASA